MPEIRLQKYIASSGLCSRRKAEELITDGKVKVNNKVITELGTKVDPERDDILVNNSKISIVDDFKYILLNKPVRVCYDCKRSI